MAHWVKKLTSYTWVYNYIRTIDTNLKLLTIRFCYIAVEKKNNNKLILHYKLSQIKGKSV